MRLFGRSQPMALPCGHPTPQAHVLEWLPGWTLIPPATDGEWDLQTRAGYEAGTPRDACNVPPHLPRDADPAVLAEWVEQELGFAVTLTPGEVDRRSDTAHPEWERCPIYWVVPT